MPVLVEINIGGEESKSGIDKKDLEKFLVSVSEYPNIKVKGLMTMGPKTDNRDVTRKYFKETYRLFIDFSLKKLHNIDMEILSMGMSRDYALAIEEGASIVRVGSNVFKTEE
jgi:uncharacterized pyridoxal phosphate-containing UPF0001 family protein